jgi:hypothetical protein
VIGLYAVTDDCAPPPPAPLRTVTANRLAFVCGPAGTDDCSPERLWEHERVIERLMEKRDLLPVRYGTRAPDEAAAAQVLRERHAELADALEGVRGAVELSVRAVGRAAATLPPSEAQTGAAYLRARAREAAERASAAGSVHEPLAQLARASTRRPGRGDGDLLRAAYLVDRNLIVRFAGRVADIQAARPELRLLCTGPWPAYSFSRHE